MLFKKNKNRMSVCQTLHNSTRQCTVIYQCTGGSVHLKNAVILIQMVALKSDVFYSYDEKIKFISIFQFLDKTQTDQQCPAVYVA